jgi:hypothetical protein
MGMVVIRSVLVVTQLFVFLATVVPRGPLCSAFPSGLLVVLLGELEVVVLRVRVQESRYLSRVCFEAGARLKARVDHANQNAVHLYPKVDENTLKMAVRITSKGINSAV